MKIKITTILFILAIIILSQLLISYYAEDRIKKGIESKLMNIKPVMAENRCYLVYLPDGVPFK